MHRDRPASARDAALLKLGRVNRWLIAGSVLLTGALSEVAAQAFPGKTVKAAAAKGSAATRAKKASSGASTTTGRRTTSSLVSVRTAPGLAVR